MNSQKITISRTHKKPDGDLFRWAHEIALTPSAGEIVEHKGTRIFKSSRNYYYGMRSDFKVHYQTMTAENSNQEWYADLYIEVAPNTFVFVNVCSDGNFTEIMDRCVELLNTQGEEGIKTLLSSMIRV